jgi:hypothetical protein
MGHFQYFFGRAMPGSHSTVYSTTSMPMRVSFRTSLAIAARDLDQAALLEVVELEAELALGHVGLRLRARSPSRSARSRPRGALH